MGNTKLKYCLVVTSDSVFRGEKEDRITPYVRGALEERGLILVESRIVPNSLPTIASVILRLVLQAGCDVVIVSGGTGPGYKDFTAHAVRLIASKCLPGYGEEFRRRSIEDIGIAGSLSRAEACVGPHGAAIFTTPGNPGSLRLALEIITELGEHIVYQARYGRHPHQKHKGHY
ncbi:MAG: hypothetical protein F7B20_00090 [Aeropyrum sp.]|nr:hypothetical protein [Aeropyrum sp.]MCE4615925.1 hypothetical protein [Aeropyrum sp.]